MALAGRHYDSLLIPPLELPWREAGALGNLAGREALIHAYTKPNGLKNRLLIRNKEQCAICLKQNRTKCCNHLKPAFLEVKRYS